MILHYALWGWVVFQLFSPYQSTLIALGLAAVAPCSGKLCLYRLMREAYSNRLVAWFAFTFACLAHLPEM
jgi:hypothetical protein